MPFDGRRVLSFESRRAREIETLIHKQGGVPFVAPSVRERASTERQPAFDFAHRLIQREFDMVICTTGVGLTLLAEVISASVPLPELIRAFSHTIRVARGPKPSAVLRQWGVPADILVPEPNTWRELLDAIAARAETSVALLEYGRPNDDLVAGLEAQRRLVSTFTIYRWDLPEDTAPLEEAARRLARREFEAVLFTSSIQLEHLLQVAETLGLAEEVLGALRETMVASIGPMMTEALQARGIAPAVEPEHPRMGALVLEAAGHVRKNDHS